MATRTQDDRRRSHPRQGQPVQPASNEQSGSTGRHTGAENLDPGKNTGQDRYGQTGLGGKVDAETIGQQDYKNSTSGSEQRRPEPSNRGSGLAHDESEKGERVGGEKDAAPLKGQKPSRR